MGAVCRTRPIWCRGHLQPDSEAQLCALSFVWFVPPHPSTLPPSTLLPCASRTSPAPQGNSAASAGETRRHDYEDETASPWRHDYVGETASLLAAAMGAVPTWEVRVKVKVNYYENQSKLLRESECEALCYYLLSLSYSDNGKLGPRVRLLFLSRRADKQRCEQAVRRHARLSHLLTRKCVGSEATDGLASLSRKPSRPCPPLGLHRKPAQAFERGGAGPPLVSAPPASPEVRLAQLT